ncbi:uncharacterized protein LOC108054056 isoform X1 [Drosophila rhopaloa]|uniref:Uncharacterized protein LOC108054056 isoform X1 n=1 Tax=Drosophila rhopaloa TaxID=1041015 RepID=A0A6P4FS11_DRORH|nr:uncharacterized protein LOC108054056 isoform X1 [Drosophila rhopaloa]
MRVHSTFVRLLILSLGPFLQVLAIHSTGNCTFADNVPLKFVCKGKVPKDMYALFRDNRAPPDTFFSAWEGEEKDGEDPILLISFYSKQLADYESISLQGPVKGLRYPYELKRHCLGYSLANDGNDVAKKPILHYGSLSYKGPVTSISDASTFSPLGALLLVVYVMIIH